MEKERSEMLKRIGKLVDPYRITRGKKFRLKDFDPGDTGGLESDQKPVARELLEKGIQWLAEEQDKLYAEDRHSLLLVFQAMDAAGKDSTIRHVMSGVNPQGCQVYSFKQPSMEELEPRLTCGATRSACRSAAASASSTGRTTRRSSSYACTRNCSDGRSCRRSS